MAQQP